MVRQVFYLLVLVGAAVCEDKWVWKRESQEKARLSKSRDREETTPRSGQNDEISNDYPDYSEFGNNAAFGYGGGPQQAQFSGGYGGRPYPRPGHNPLQGHPSNGVLVGPGGPTGIIGRPRPNNYYNNGYGGNNFGPQGFGSGDFGGGFPQGAGFPGQGFGAQGLPGQGQGFGAQGLPGQGPGFPGGFSGQQGFGGGLGGFGGASGFPNGQGGFAQLQQGNNGGAYGNYGLVTPNQLGLNFGGPYGGRPLFDEPEKDNKVEGKSERITNKISNKI